MSKGGASDMNKSNFNPETDLSPRQTDILNLMIKAEGKAYVWIKKNKARLINPSEIVIVTSKEVKRPR